MLETVREFGLERLTASGEEPAVQAAHAAFFVALAEEAEEALHGPSQRLWFDRLDDEFPDLRAALAWATLHAPDQALRIGGALQLFWLVRGHLGEARETLSRALAAGEGKPQVRIKAMITLAWIVYAQGDLAASLTLAERALALARGSGDRPGIAGALQVVGFGESALGRGAVSSDRIRLARAATAFEEQLDLARDWVISEESRKLCTPSGLWRFIRAMSTVRPGATREHSTPLRRSATSGVRLGHCMRSDGWRRSAKTLWGRLRPIRRRSAGSVRSGTNGRPSAVEDVAWLGLRAKRADEAVRYSEQPMPSSQQTGLCSPPGITLPARLLSTRRAPPWARTLLPPPGLPVDSLRRKRPSTMRLFCSNP